MHARFLALAFTALLAVAHVAPTLGQIGHIIIKPFGCSCM